MSASNFALLRENPKGDGESWEEWGTRLAKKYPTPAATPNLPFVPGYDKFRKFFSIPSSHNMISNIPIPPPADTWDEYGTQWKGHYNTMIAGKPVPTPGPTLPPLPAKDATSQDWAAWGKAVANAWNEYAKEKGVDLTKVVEGLKRPELTNNDWASFAQEWEVYGTQVADKFQAALVVNSA